MQNSSQYKSVGDIKFSSITEESVVPSLQFEESPRIKNTVETLDFPTEDTSRFKSSGSPATGTSSMPLSRMYGKLVSSPWGTMISEKLKYLKDETHSLLNSPDNKTLDEEEKIVSPNEVFELHTEAYDQDALEINKEIPTLAWCAYCKGERKTHVHFVNSSKTFWSSVGIFFMGGVLGCFLLPYFTNQCKTPQVVCTNCQHRLYN